MISIRDKLSGGARSGQCFSLAPIFPETAPYHLPVRLPLLDAVTIRVSDRAHSRAGATENAPEV